MPVGASATRTRGCLVWAGQGEVGAERGLGWAGVAGLAPRAGRRGPPSWTWTRLPPAFGQPADRERIEAGGLEFRTGGKESLCRATVPAPCPQAARRRSARAYHSGTPEIPSGFGNLVYVVGRLVFGQDG